MVSVISPQSPTVSHSPPLSPSVSHSSLGNRHKYQDNCASLDLHVNEACSVIIMWSSTKCFKNQKTCLYTSTVPKNAPHASNVGVQNTKSFWGTIPPDPPREGVLTHIINSLAPLLFTHFANPCNTTVYMFTTFVCGIAATEYILCHVHA